MSELYKRICAPCGVKYLSEKQKQSGGVTTFNKGECIDCGKQTHVTSIRYYNYLRSE